MPVVRIHSPKLHRSCRTVQIEYRFEASTNHVNMRRSMVVRINHNSQSPEPKKSRHHSNSIKFLSAWVFAALMQADG